MSNNKIKVFHEKWGDNQNLRSFHVAPESEDV
jgi:hypothetical protein